MPTLRPTLRPLLTPLLWLGLLPTCLAAQAPAHPSTLLPQGALFEIELDGFAKLETLFAKTRLWSLLGEPQAQELLSSSSEETEPEDVDLMTRVEAVLQEFGSNHRGRIAFAGGGDISSWLGEVYPWSEFWGLLVITPDEQLSAKKIRDELMRGIVPETMEPAPYRLLGQPLLRSQIGALDILHPVIVDGCVVLGWASDAEERVPEWTRRRIAPIPGAIGLRLKLERLIEDLMFRFVDTDISEDEDDIYEQFKSIRGILGLDHIADATVSISPLGPHVEMRIEWPIALAGESILHHLVPKPGPFRLLKDIPRDDGFWAFNRIDVSSLLRKLLNAYDARLARKNKSREELDAEIQSFLGVRLMEDVVAHLGDEFISIGPTDPAKLELGQLASAGGAYLFELRNAPAFEKSLLKMLRKRVWHVSRKRIGEGEQRYYRFLAFGIPVYYAIRERWAVFGYGNYGKLALERMLAPRSKSEWSAPIQERLQAAGQDWEIWASFPLSDILITVAEGEDRVFREGCALAQELFIQHDLDHAIGVYRVTRFRCSLRVIW